MITVVHYPVQRARFEAKSFTMMIPRNAEVLRFYNADMVYNVRMVFLVDTGQPLVVRRFQSIRAGSACEFGGRYVGHLNGQEIFDMGEAT